MPTLDVYLFDRMFALFGCLLVFTDPYFRPPGLVKVFARTFGRRVTRFKEKKKKKHFISCCLLVCFCLFICLGLWVF